MQDEHELKILMLEDSADDAMLVQHTLQNAKLSFVYERVDTRDEFNEAIRRFRPDVILSDHSLPGFNSREALKISTELRLNPAFILVTGTVSEDYAVACIREGADDYILKSNLSRLPDSIRIALKKRRLEKLKRATRLELRKQNSALRKANYELDSFVYSVSHTLRGPLASVLGLLDLASKENQLTGVRNLHGMMRESLSKLDDTLGVILEYARNVHYQILIGEIEWKRIIQLCLDRIEHLDPDNLIEKQIIIKSDGAFYSDAGRIQIILTHILSNAVRFSKPDASSSILIEIIVSNQEATMIVRDKGFGIPSSVLPHVYEIFFRGMDSSGSGLGLFVVREIVTKLKGTIEIMSSEGQGTMVIINLPNEQTDRHK